MTVAVALAVNVVSLVVMFRIRRDAAALTRMLHAEHPEGRGEAWCGAEVLEVRGRNLGPIDCVVCSELRETSRRRSCDVM